jgi:coenzyme F420-0:L-glutamate ligase/coenzyme F420-1:gamma-L-glutamate ligase
MAAMGETLSVHALRGMPRVAEGDDLGALLIAALDGLDAPPADGDVVVVAQKVVSRAEGKFRHLSDVTASQRAEELALKCNKDPRLVELILQESQAVVRCEPGVLIVTHRTGHTMANAGIDRSNVAGDDEMVLLLPDDPDRWCVETRLRLEAHYDVRLGVLMSDSFGRPWRLGTTGVAIGASGLPALLDVRGRADLDGRVLEVTQIGVGDEVAAAASLLMGQAGEGVPVCLVRGLKESGDAPASALLRADDIDLFRRTDPT